MTTHAPALLWAADRAGLSYDRFIQGLTPTTIQRIRGAYLRANGTTIPLPAVLPTVEAEQPDSPASQTSEERLDETTLRAAFKANMHTLPYMVSAYKYRRFLEALNVNLSSKTERKQLEKIVREEIRNVNEPTAIKLNHFLWWLEGQ